MSAPGASRLVTCPACTKMVPQTSNGKVWRHSPSVRHIEALRADGSCTGSGQAATVLGVQPPPEHVHAPWPGPCAICGATL